jgi:hypothetical protein
MKPDIILDLGAELETFKRKTLFLPNHDEFVVEVINSILEHIIDEVEAEANLVEYAASVKEDHMQMQEPLSEELAEMVSEAVHEFAVAMFQQIRDHGAYNKEGMFTYKLGEFVGNDILLTPMAPEDFPEIDSESDPE